MIEALFVEGLLKNTTKTIDNEDFINRNKMSSEDFTRDRKLSFKDLLVVLMSLTRPSVQTELDRFYKAISKSPTSFESVSKSAFTQSRRKLKPEAFIELAKTQLSYFEKNAPYKKYWKGHRIVSIDGSSLGLPNAEELKKEFGVAKNQFDSVITAKCSFAYDVCNGLILDAIVAPYSSCEKELAVNHLSQLDPAKDVLVFDRGYPSQWLIGLLMQKGFKFCFRLSSSWKDALELLDKDCDVNWILKRRSNKDVGKMKKYGIPNKLEGLRLVSIKLPSGEKEILATNLINREVFSIEDLGYLYNQRWGVEEVYKLFKNVLHIEHFTGKTTQAIKQDFYAKVFMFNMASMIGSQGRSQRISKKKSKHKLQLNKTQLVAKTKDFLTNLFYSNKLIKAVILLLNLINQRLDIVRPNRSFPRTDTSKRRRRRTINSKGI
jgi:hypothetical protein